MYYFHVGNIYKRTLILLLLDITHTYHGMRKQGCIMMWKVVKKKGAEKMKPNYCGYRIPYK